MSFAIISDTSCNVPMRILEPEDITLVPFSYYQKDDDSNVMQCIDIDSFNGKEFYDRIRQGILYNTSQVSPGAYFDTISEYAKKGQDVLYISMSSGISGSYNSSLVAKKMLEEEFPERKFFMLDTKAASLGEGIVLLEAIELRKQGLTIEECYEKLSKMSECVYQVFTVDSLRHLQRTGRLSNAAMIIGNLLNIKPILMGNELGQIINVEKVRGNKKAIKEMADRYDKLVKDPGSQIVGIAHSDNEEDTAYLIELLNKSNPPKEILTVCYEPVTGSHVGPGTVALFFLGDENVRSYQKAQTSIIDTVRNIVDDLT
ncbi:MAG: DegV family protein [Lachnospiraceae bacterium]|nr:DegV family protein [Lachnospiraceae bacterium]